jgi:cell division protein FtsB
MNDELKSRSQLRRLAVQDPDALVVEIEQLRAENQRLTTRISELEEDLENLQFEINKKGGMGWPE